MVTDKIKKGQILRIASLSFGGILFFALILIASKSGHKTLKKETTADFTGVIDKQFSEADSESAMSSQQLEVDGLKKQVATLTDGIKKIQEQNEAQNTLLMEKMVAEIARVKTDTELKFAEKTANPTILASNDVVTPSATTTDATYQNSGMLARLNKPTRIHSVSYPYKKRRAHNFYKNPSNYVPSGTFAKAVVLGGVDADASVDGQNKNNGVMLFKIINSGILPNGKRSHLAGCFVTASAYGDISSERAYVKLDKISCVHDGNPIVDKAVTGWAFFGGKVGIKGVPLMRDSKIVAWAGISGALSGIAQAAQYAQSVQNFGSYGATSIVPSSNIAPFAGYGGASKAADQLSQYYIKRAEQYHPVIQVGSGNVVNIVIKDGFYLYDEPERKESSYQSAQNNDPIVPQEVLAQINQAQLGQELPALGTSK
jgi:conjugal transfer pilus assembly protein TraB